MNTVLRKKARNHFEKDYFKLINNAVFGKTMENMRKGRYIMLVTTKATGNYLVLEQNYHTTKVFSDNLLAIEMERTRILVNKSIHLGLSVS